MLIDIYYRNVRDRGDMQRIDGLNDESACVYAL